MMRRSLLLRCNCFAQRQNLRHDWLDLPRIDQVCDLCEIVGVRMNRDRRSVNAAFF
jgi:hypothetical protein